MEENTLSVLKIAPGQHPQQVEIDNDLKALQQAVGGSIDAVYPFADPVAIICNDEGKLMGLPLNRALRDENGQMYDAVAGTFWWWGWARRILHRSPRRWHRSTSSFSISRKPF